MGPEMPTNEEFQAETSEDLNTPEWDLAFQSAEWYKKDVEVGARQVSEDASLTTQLSDGHIETTNVAHSGDYIVTNPGGEEYAMSEEKFLSKYEAVEGQNSRYKAKGEPIKAVQITEDIEFTAPWGERMSMRAGDWIVDAGGGDRYGIGAKEFTETYKQYTEDSDKEETEVDRP